MPAMPRSPARSGRLRHRGTCGPTGALHLAAMLIYPCLAQARHARKDLKHGGADGSGGAMSIELQTVTKIASLSRISVTDDEAEAMVAEPKNIMGRGEQLGGVEDRKK